MFLLLHQDLSSVLTIYVIKEMSLNFASSGLGTGRREGARGSGHSCRAIRSNSVLLLGEFFYEERKTRADLSSFVSRTSFICLSRAKYPQLHFCGISSKMKRKQHSLGVGSL